MRARRPPLTDSTETVRYLFSLQWRGMKLGLRNTRQLLRAAGHPERTFPSVHIAGTNGKGSTASFVASIGTAAGFRTGLYTSPHLVRFTERIRIDGREIPEDRLRWYVDILRPSIEEVQATFFEATTCIAFLYFADEAVDLAVIETGLGGRYDATNVLRPLVSVITNIAFDHTEHLGTSVQAIAREKGGIIKEGTPVVTGSDDPAALAVFRKIAAQQEAPLYLARRLVRITGWSGCDRAIASTPRMSLGRVRLGLRGPHQWKNARLAIATWILLKRRAAFAGVQPGRMRKGLEQVCRNTGLRGRLERIGGVRGWVIDVAHNPAGMRALVEGLAACGIVPAVAVFGVMRDKDFAAMLRTLSGTVRKIVAVSPNMERALPSPILVRQAARLGIETRHGGSVAAGMAVARRWAGHKGPLLITGSHYVAAEAYAVLASRRT